MGPAVRFPPPLLFIGGFLIALALERWVWPSRAAGAPTAVMLIGGGVLFVMGVLLMLWAMVTFVRARTAILPFRPASTIVTSGPFQFTRNPMYLGLTLSYLGLALVSAILWAIAVLPFVLIALQLLVIRREETYLSRTFGDEYAAYRNRVRRWI